MDLFISPTFDGADIEILPNKNPRLTGGLSNSALLSLFTSNFWGNALEGGPRYDSPLPDLMAQALTNRARLSAITGTKKALSWMVDNQIAQSVEADAVISSPVRLDLSVKIQKRAGVENLAFGINWDYQLKDLAPIPKQVLPKNVTALLDMITSDQYEMTTTEGVSMAYSATGPEATR